MERVHELMDAAYRQGDWEPVSYRSTKEIKAKIEPPLTAFETTWTLTEKRKPELEQGQKRRPRGSIRTVEIEVRCVFYRHELNAQKEKERRDISKEKLVKALQEYGLKLNKRKYQELDYCKEKLAGVLKAFCNVKEFLTYDLGQTDTGAISLTWVWNEEALAHVIALFVLTFLRSYTAREGVKTTERKLQESMGDMLLEENTILPLGLKVYGVARDTELNQLIRETFSLPNPLELIKVLSEAEIARVDDYVGAWYEERRQPSAAPD